MIAKLCQVVTAFLLAFVIFGVLAVARAQTYNPEDKWIGKSIRKQLRHEDDYTPTRRGLTIEYRDRYKPRRHYYAPPRDHHHGPRVYGVVIRKGSTTVQDATGHVECFPPIEARSHERQSEDNAWDDAQRSWQNTVRWKYGERVMNVQHATDITKRCNVSTVSEAVVGKMIEQVKGAFTGDDNGRRWRCEIRAAPCMAPADKEPNVKGDR